MMIQCRFESIKGIKAHEWILRFLFGGAVCVFAGLMSKWFGREVGGLFLAFPAIFPASASLVESHERAHKARAGMDGTMRARTVAGIDAAGASIGCIGLAGFALLCWLPPAPPRPHRRLRAGHACLAAAVHRLLVAKEVADLPHATQQRPARLPRVLTVSLP